MTYFALVLENVNENIESITINTISTMVGKNHAFQNENKSINLCIFTVEYYRVMQTHEMKQYDMGIS